MLLSHRSASVGSCSAPGREGGADAVSSRTASQDWGQQSLHPLFSAKLTDCQLVLWHDCRNWCRGTQQNDCAGAEFHGLPQAESTSSSWDWLLQTSPGRWTVVRSWFSLPSPRTVHFPAYRSSEELQWDKSVVPAMKRRCQSFYNLPFQLQLPFDSSEPLVCWPWAPTPIQAGGRSLP